MTNTRKIPPIGLYSFVTTVLLTAMLFLLQFCTLFIESKNITRLDQIEYIMYTLIFIFMILFLADATTLSKRRGGKLRILEKPSDNRSLTVVLTAYNDELSIGDAVNDFIQHPNVKRVLVIDNNSVDGTSKVAELAKAVVIIESKQGYGRCVYRALDEASQYLDTDLIVLCEGDMTFRARDIDKLLAYEAHGDIINGTRISEQLRMPDTQLTNFIYFGNFFVGKLLELKHLGKGTLTDVGTTYKLCKSEFIRKNLRKYNPEINHEFNAHFLDRSLQIGARVVEVPITFYKRVGKSKGGNSSNIAAIRVGLSMMRGIIFGWPNLEEHVETQ